MLSKELNLKLIEFLPEIKELYEDEVSWQEGDETGSHTVFSDVLFPYIMNNLDDNEISKKNFEVIEKILRIHDDYADEVVTLSVLENLFYEQDVAHKIKKYLGELSAEIMGGFEI